MRLPALALIGVCLGLLAACSGGNSGRPEVSVAAAADLQYAFEELRGPFEEQCGCELVLTFGSSGKFAAQIEAGLPADVFASANEGYIDSLEGKGLVVAGSKRLYAVGRIVLAVPAGSSLDPADFSSVAGPEVKRLSIANPEHAPYGVAAKEALESAGLWEAVQDRLVMGENASQAAQFVETGDADAGIIPLSLAVQAQGSLRYTLIDDSLHHPLRQAAAVLSRSAHKDLAVEFIDFIAGGEGREVLAKYGFEAPDE